MVSKIRVKLEDDPTIWKFLIEPEWLKIKDLEKYLKEIFNLDQIKLLDDDGFLHPNSNISYVHCMSQNNEILTIRSLIANSKINEKRSSKRRKTDNNDYIYKNCEDANSKNISNNINNIDIILNKIMSTIKEPSIENDLNKVKKQKLTINEEKQLTYNIDMKSSDKSLNTIHNQNVEDDSTESELLLKKSKKRKRRKKKISQEIELSTTIENNLVEVESKKKEKSIKKDKSKTNPFKDQNTNIKAELSTKHFHFDEMGEPINGDRETKIIFVDCLENIDPDKPRVIKPIIVHLNGQLTDECVESNKNNEDLVEDETRKLNCSFEENSQGNFIGPQISAEFIKHKLEKWDSFQSNKNPNGPTFLEATHVETDIKLNADDNSKIIIISNEIISNGINTDLMENV